MAKNFIQDGRYLEVTAPAGLSSGDFVKVGSVFGFAQNDALIGAAVQIDTAGVYSIACASAAVIAVGDPLYWDVADGEVNKTALGNWYVGVAASAAGNGVTSVDIRLNGSMPAAVGA